MIYNTGFEALLAGMVAATLAQIIKFFSYLITHKNINFKMLTTTGGMPSSHSAGVVGLAASIGLISGFDSTVFAVASGYALVVMHDAAGLRRAAGKMASSLNKIKDELYAHNTQVAGEKLKELLGHTPVEVFAGAIWGALVAYLFHFYLFGHNYSSILW